MNGTVNCIVNIYDLDGKLAIQAHVGDRVEMIDGRVRKLERNGRLLISGSYLINSDCVVMDVVVVPTPIPPIGERYGVVKLDYDQEWPSSVIPDKRLRFHVSRPTRNKAGRYTKGLPATARFKDDVRVILTPDLQFWIHDICWRLSGQSEEEAKKSWHSLTANDRYTTNFYGSNTNADYVNGTLPYKPAMQWQPMVTGGAILKIIGERVYYGEDCWVFEAINALGNYRQHSPETHPHLFYHPTNSVRVEINNARGKWTGYYRENKSDPFPQYNGKARVPVFAVGKNENYLPKWRIRILKTGEIWPSPFVP